MRWLLLVLLLVRCFPAEREARVSSVSIEEKMKYTVKLKKSLLGSENIGWMHLSTVCRAGDCSAIGAQKLECECAVCRAGKCLVTGQMKAAPNKGHIKDQRVHTYNPQEGYSLSIYNGFTLPLRLRYLALIRQKNITAISKLVAEIAQAEQSFKHKAFSRLHTLKYDFTGLENQKKIAFNGKRFSRKPEKVEKEIEKREIDLSKDIKYQIDDFSIAIPVDAHQIYEKAALIYQQVFPERKMPKAIRLDLTPKSGEYSPAFEGAAIHFLVLKQARLLLATTLLGIYAPFKLKYSFKLGGTKKLLLVEVRQNDDPDTKSAVIRYEMQATTDMSGQDGWFDLGHTDHSADGLVTGMSLSLKPLGSAQGLARLELTLDDKS